MGTEALQSRLPHQLDLRTEQLWADGQSTLQLHQQRQPARASAHITSFLVLPLDSEIVAPVLILATSTDWKEAAHYLGVCGSRSIGDFLSLEGDVTDSDAVSIPDDVELGNHTCDRVCAAGGCRRLERLGLDMFGRTDG